MIKMPYEMEYLHGKTTLDTFKITCMGLTVGAWP